MLRKHKEFFEEYHRGACNILLHFLGFALYGYGIGKENWILIVLSPLIFESGHLINYFIGNRTKHDRLMIPIQLLTWIVFILLGVIVVALL